MVQDGIVIPEKQSKSSKKMFKSSHFAPCWSWKGYLKTYLALSKFYFYPSFCVPINKSHRFWNKRDCIFPFTNMPFSSKAVIFSNFGSNFASLLKGIWGKYLYQKCNIWPKMLKTQHFMENANCKQWNFALKPKFYSII